jgi:hypothetical protein
MYCGRLVKKYNYDEVVSERMRTWRGRDGLIFKGDEEGQI